MTDDILYLHFIYLHFTYFDMLINNDIAKYLSKLKNEFY